MCVTDFVLTFIWMSTDKVIFRLDHVPFETDVNFCFFFWTIIVQETPKRSHSSVKDKMCPLPRFCLQDLIICQFDKGLGVSLMGKALLPSLPAQSSALTTCRCFLSDGPKLSWQSRSGILGEENTQTKDTFCYTSLLRGTFEAVL